MTVFDSHTFDGFMKDYRKKHHLTQQVFATRLNVRMNALQYWESGTSFSISGANGKIHGRYVAEKSPLLLQWTLCNDSSFSLILIILFLYTLRLQDPAFLTFRETPYIMYCHL